MVEAALSFPGVIKTKNCVCVCLQMHLFICLSPYVSMICSVARFEYILVYLFHLYFYSLKGKKNRKIHVENPTLSYLK